MNKTKYIGVDFSPNSPGFCILTEDSCKLISIFRTTNIIPKLLKKESSPFKVFTENKLVDINIIEKQEFSGEYHEKERDKLLNSIYFSDLVLQLLEPYLDENTLISMEGISYGSQGNALVDISMVTALVRAGIIKKINPDNFYVFSPSSVKKFAVKGNAKKDELYYAFIEKKKNDIRFKELIDVFETNKDKWVKGPKKVEGPCSDLIDSIWLSLFLEENLEKLLSGKKI